MDKIETVLGNFRELYQKMAYLNRVKMEKALSEFKSSEVHCLEFVGKNEDSNVTKMADAFYMTRGAMSKITKKLIEKGVLESYQKNENKKEIYFKLTAKGLKVFNIHESLHQLFKERDSFIFESISEEQLTAMLSFMNRYNEHLDREIEKLPKE